MANECKSGPVVWINGTECLDHNGRRKIRKVVADIFHYNRDVSSVEIRQENGQEKICVVLCEGANEENFRMHLSQRAWDIQDQIDALKRPTSHGTSAV